MGTRPAGQVPGDLAAPHRSREGKRRSVKPAAAIRILPVKDTVLLEEVQIQEEKAPETAVVIPKVAHPLGTGRRSSGRRLSPEVLLEHPHRLILYLSKLLVIGVTVWLLSLSKGLTSPSDFFAYHRTDRRSVPSLGLVILAGIGRQNASGLCSQKGYGFNYGYEFLPESCLTDGAGHNASLTVTPAVLFSHLNDGHGQPFTLPDMQIFENAVYFSALILAMSSTELLLQLVQLVPLLWRLTLSTRLQRWTAYLSRTLSLCNFVFAHASLGLLFQMIPSNALFFFNADRQQWQCNGYSPDASLHMTQDDDQLLIVWHQNFVAIFCAACLAYLFSHISISCKLLYTRRYIIYRAANNYKWSPYFKALGFMLCVKERSVRR